MLFNMNDATLFTNGPIVANQPNVAELKREFEQLFADFDATHRRQSELSDKSDTEASSIDRRRTE